MIMNVIPVLERRCAMNGRMDETRHFRIPADAPESAAEIIELV